MYISSSYVALSRTLPHTQHTRTHAHVHKCALDMWPAPHTRASTHMPHPPNLSRPSRPSLGLRDRTSQSHSSHAARLPHTPPRCTSRLSIVGTPSLKTAELTTTPWACAAAPTGTATATATATPQEQTRTTAGIFFKKKKKKKEGIERERGKKASASLLHETRPAGLLPAPRRLPNTRDETDNSGKRRAG